MALPSRLKRIFSSVIELVNISKMTLTICLWVYSKIRLQLWQATKYCKCINNFNLRSMTFNNFFYLIYFSWQVHNTQHLIFRFLISGRQLHMVSVEVCNILCSCTNDMVLLQAKAWVCNILCHLIIDLRCNPELPKISRDAKFQ